MREQADGGLVSRRIPTMAVAAVGVLMLYLTVVLSVHSEQPIYGEWLIGLLVAVLGARAVLFNYARRLQRVIGIAGLLVIAGSFFFTIFGWLPSAVGIHGLVLVLMCSLFWSFTLPLVEQCTGAPPEFSRMRYPVTLSRRFPFIRFRRPTDRPETPTFSGSAVIIVVIIASMIFAIGEYLSFNAEFKPEDNPIYANPLPYALAFYILMALLASLTRLAKTLREVPHGVQLSGRFVPAWMGGSLAVLILCGLLALALPKQAIIAPVQAVRRLLTGEGGQQPRPPDLPSGQDPRRPPDLPPTVSGKPAPPAGRIRPPSPLPSFNPRGQAGGRGTPSSSGLRRVTDGAMNLLYRVATAFEPSPEGTKRLPGNGQYLGPGTPPPGVQPNSSPGRQGPQVQPSPPKPTASPYERLKRTLQAKPFRWVKLVLAGILFLAAVYLFFRYVLPFLVRITARLRALLARLLARLLGPFQRRLAARWRELRLQQLLRTLPDPFADPFASASDTLPEELTSRAYEVFIAHLRLLDIERREDQTAFDFANRICEKTSLDNEAVWTLTRGCVQAYFSAAVPPGEQLAELRRALQTLVTQVTANLPPAEFEARKAAYRRRYAEQLLDARQGRLAERAEVRV